MWLKAAHTDSRAGDQFNMELSQKELVCGLYGGKGIEQRTDCFRYGRTEPFVMDVKDGKLRLGAISPILSKINSEGKRIKKSNVQ